MNEERKEGERESSLAVVPIAVATVVASRFETTQKSRNKYGSHCQGACFDQD